MNPTISNLEEQENTLRFRIAGINVSFANALRRIMLSEIPCVVMKAVPHRHQLLILLKIQLE